ncbi:MAG: PA2169 family four-helix-bundle protein [Sphingobacteriales bacterium]|nr:MAG: PA2169 family four-helix-bundle protein [Sphingobacteriales bacterium]
MQNKEGNIEILNDLVKINNDRIAGYERAISEAKDLDVDLKATFESMINESRGYKSELEAEVVKDGGEIEDDTTISGKIYRAWMDVKATFTGSDRKSILESCEFGEDAAQRAYEGALADDSSLDADSRTLVQEQQRTLKASHDLIKKYRDAHSK